MGILRRFQNTLVCIWNMGLERDADSTDEPYRPSRPAPETDPEPTPGTIPETTRETSAPVPENSPPACIEMDETGQRRGYIMIIMGPMFSGKTTEILRLHERHERAGKKGLLVKFVQDTRYDNEAVATHDKKFGGGATVKASVLEEVRDRLFALDVDVVSIDEGQFFADLASVVKELVKHNKIVYVAALNGTFAKEPFEQVSLLLPHVDDLSLLRAVCSCGHDAPFSYRFDDDQTVVVIGGEDAYRAVCRSCYSRVVQEKETR